MQVHLFDFVKGTGRVQHFLARLLLLGEPEQPLLLLLGEPDQPLLSLVREPEQPANYMDNEGQGAGRDRRVPGVGDHVRRQAGVRHRLRATTDEQQAAAANPSRSHPATDHQQRPPPLILPGHLSNLACATRQCAVPVRNRLLP
jgi:hypothetical protein